MIHILIGIALKSLLIAGITLGLLAVMKRRSAAERSWVAHIGLLALVIMALAPLALPRWNVEAPALFAPAPHMEQPVRVSSSQGIAAAAEPSKASAVAPIAAPSRSPVNLAAVTTALYAVPAALLLFVTMLALTRLITLRARAEVLVDGHWLSALARAQRRMGFKHGTALLTSNDLASPISWGLMRPVILLNSRAVQASGEAEAIIAHELAHVARMDWAKLLLARIATALFWFNPFVWLLAREANQLREETADDAVLAADIPDTDYARLLVGVARHDCPGMLLGAHGVAPCKSSLSRRVARVLDSASARAPVARSFALGVFAGAVLVAAPLAALTLTPAASKTAPAQAASTSTIKPGPVGPYYLEKAIPTDLPSIIADGVSTSVNSAVAAVSVSDFGPVSPREIAAERAEAARDAREAAQDARADAVADRADAFARAVEARAARVSPEHIGEMRAAVPRLGSLDASEFVGLRSLGVTPAYARDMVAAFPSITAEGLEEARAVGLTGGYIREIRAAGVNGSLDDFIHVKAVGVDADFAARARRSSSGSLSADDLIKLQALSGARPPIPPRPPNVPSRGWSPFGKNPGASPDG